MPSEILRMTIVAAYSENAAIRYLRTVSRVQMIAV